MLDLGQDDHKTLWCRSFWYSINILTSIPKIGIYIVILTPFGNQFHEINFIHQIIIIIIISFKSQIHRKKLWYL